MQLKQPLVQKWTTTTLPRRPFIVNGSELIHRVTPLSSGTGARSRDFRYWARDGTAIEAVIPAARTSTTIWREKRNVVIGYIPLSDASHRAMTRAV